MSGGRWGRPLAFDRHALTRDTVSRAHSILAIEKFPEQGLSPGVPETNELCGRGTHGPDGPNTGLFDPFVPAKSEVAPDETCGR